jgi:hypothetical protein
MVGHEIRCRKHGESAEEIATRFREIRDFAGVSFTADGDQGPL